MKPKGRKKKSSKVSTTINLDDDTTCSVCFAEFVDPDDLTQHTALVHSRKRSSNYECNICLTNCSDLLDLCQHIRDQHLSDMKICKLCLTGFDNISEYFDHKKLHISTLTSKYKCSQCNIIFRNPTLLKEHEVNEHDCPERGVSLGKLSPYFQTVFCNNISILLETQESYTCRQCYHQSSDLSFYVKHLKKTGCQISTCDNCHKIVKKIQAHCKKCIGKPVATKVAKKNDLVDCKVCFKPIMEKNYQQHVKMCRKLKCKHCDVVLGSLNEFTQHQRLHPVSIVMKTCRYCKLMISIDTFHKHVKKLHGNTYKSFKYNCVYCNMIFNHPQKLFGHFLGQHKEIAPYTCKICDKKFKVRSRFTIHIKMEHKSEGHVEFDENFSVYFVKDKSENPFIPQDNPNLFTAEELLDKPISDNYESDINTDIEASKRKNQRLETDLETENEMPDQKPKVLRKKSQRKPKPVYLTETDSDSEPLIKKIKKKSKKKTIYSRFVCNICNKKCYTLENFNRHMTFHFKKQSKQCIKCAKLFKTIGDLKSHMSTEHSSSQLTKTLQELIAKRNTPHMINIAPENFNIYKTMRKVISTPCQTAATISLVDPNKKKQSVKNYIESFYSETGQTQDISDSSTSLTIKKVTGKKPVTNFKPNIVKYTKPVDSKPSKKLKMPVKYRAYYQDNAKAKIKLIKNDTRHYTDYGNTTYVYEDQSFQEHDDADQNIPEVAEEVYLENTMVDTCENLPSNSTSFRKLVIPNVPEHMDRINEYHIGHIQPQAPYIKVTPIRKLLANVKPKPEPETECLQLSSGTKLVRTNPLAHLLGKDTVALTQQAKSKYYTPKITNVTNAIAKALMKLKTPQIKKVTKKKAKKVNND